MKWLDNLERLRPCTEALSWAKAYPTLQAAWDACERGDWLLWYLGHSLPHTERPKLVLAACACARLALAHVPAGEDHPRMAIETAERWARGEATLEEVRAAANAAYAAVAVANAAYAAVAVANAAYAANAANAAAVAANAAYAAADAAATRPETLARCAALVREIFPTPPGA